MDDDSKDAVPHAPHLQGRHPARTRREESRYARRDAFEVYLPGNHHHPGPDRGDSEIPTLTASLHVGAHMCGDCAPLVGDSRAALGGCALARGEESNFKAL